MINKPFSTLTEQEQDIFISNLNKPIFLYLDDDSFHKEGIRNPEKYYIVINAIDILEKSHNYEVIKMTTVEDSQKFILKYGVPSFISFDNDLMTKLEGIDLAKWLVEEDLNKNIDIPAHFEFFVHSQNNQAKPRIYSLLNSYLEHKFSKQKKMKFS